MRSDCKARNHFRPLNASRHAAGQALTKARRRFFSGSRTALDEMAFFFDTTEMLFTGTPCKKGVRR